MTTPLTSSLARYCRTMTARRNMWSGVMAGLGRLSNSRTSRSQTLPRPGMARTRSAPLTAGTVAPVRLSCCMAMVPPVVMMTTFDMEDPVCLAEKREQQPGAAPDGGNGRLVSDLRGLLKERAGEGCFSRQRLRAFPFLMPHPPVVSKSVLYAPSAPWYQNSFMAVRRRARIFHPSFRVAS